VRHGRLPIAAYLGGSWPPAGSPSPKKLIAEIGAKLDGLDELSWEITLRCLSCSGMTLEQRPVYLTAKHRQFVAEHHDLKFLELARA